MTILLKILQFYALSDIKKVHQIFFKYLVIYHNKVYIFDYNMKGCDVMSLFDHKKVIIIGDRDGIPGPAIEACLEATEAEVVFSSTECFV